MRWQPLGDQAAIGYAPSEEAAAGQAAAIRKASFPWLLDVVQAYASVGVFFDLNRTDLTQVQADLYRLANVDSLEAPGGSFLIPCCYELGLDLRRIAEHAHLPEEEIIRLHGSRAYTVYAIGFCPGFPYLGYLPAELSGVPRLPAPRLQVASGSVGLTGRQTGIYTEARPGGWNIVGRTPLELVNVADNYFPLHTGDRVRFQAIDEREFRRLQGQRL